MRRVVGHCVHFHSREVGVVALARLLVRKVNHLGIHLVVARVQLQVAPAQLQAQLGPRREHPAALRLAVLTSVAVELAHLIRWAWFAVVNGEPPVRSRGTAYVAESDVHLQVIVLVGVVAPSRCRLFAAGSTPADGNIIAHDHQVGGVGLPFRGHDP